MIRRLTVVTGMLLFSGLAAAQNPSPVQLNPGARPAVNAAFPALQKEARMAYLVKQLNLTPEQKTQADGLMSMYRANTQDRKPDLQHVQALYAQLEQAKKDGNKELEQQITEQFRKMGSTEDADREFLTNLEAMLTPEQKAKLEAAQQRLAENPSGALSPRDVVRAARDLNLSSDQSARLDAAVAAFRKEVNAVPNFDTLTRVRMLDQFINTVSQLLSPEQKAQLDAKLEPMWVESQTSLLTAARAPQPPPATQPNPGEGAP